MKKSLFLVFFLFILPILFPLEELWSGGRALVIFPDGKEISAQVAKSAEERERGLMFKEALDDNEGMLFIFEKDGFHSFWMKNCRIPLDIIWMDAQVRVVHIKKAAPPCGEDEKCPSIFPSRKARYVLEVKAGVASASDIKIGDDLIMISLPDRISPRSK